MQKNTARILRTIAITTGDPDGIGFEVTAKSLVEIGPQPNTFFFVFRDSKQEEKQKRFFNQLDSQFSRLTFTSVKAALGFYDLLRQSKSLDSHFLFDLALEESAADWVIMCTRLCHDKNFTSLVTGPLSKTLIKDSGYNYVGHTGIFRHYYPHSQFFMGFKGEHFNVVLMTDHIALRDVEKSVDNLKLLKLYFDACLQFQKRLIRPKKMALLGLNPHAGEKGLIGGFEKKLLASAWFKKGYAKKFIGPLSADGAFLKKNWAQFSTYLAFYHDQGLIPFKAIHGQDSGVHITLGLPFVRTSVDHGTAKELFNKNRAVHLSMRDAILYNIRLIQGKKI
jgi:4-hydroxy-L-threonine phosphate dehydrogenase PdxA